MPDKYGREYYFERLGHDCTKSDGDSESTISTIAVCEGMYIDKVDAVIALCETLRAIYALTGENREVRELIHTTLQKYDI